MLPRRRPRGHPADAPNQLVTAHQELLHHPWAHVQATVDGDPAARSFAELIFTYTRIP